MTTKSEPPRSTKWRELEQEFLRQHPQCEVCGTTSELNVHHQIPFEYCIELGRPDLELNPANLITLCNSAQHHILVGHLDSFESYNPDVLTDVKTFANKTRSELMADVQFQDKVAKRPLPIHKMDQDSRSALLTYLNQRFPMST